MINARWLALQALLCFNFNTCTITNMWPYYFSLYLIIAFREYNFLL